MKGLEMNRWTWATVWASLALAAIVGGCEVQSEIDAAETRNVAQQALDDAKARLETLPPVDPGRLAVEREIARIENAVKKYDEARAAEAARGTPEPDASIAAGVSTVGTLLPPPFNAIALIGAGLVPGIIGLIRENRKRKAEREDAEQLAKSIQAVAIANGGVVDFTKQPTRDALKAAMRDGSREIVNAAGATVPVPEVAP